LIPISLRYILLPATVLQPLADVGPTLMEYKPPNTCTEA